MTGIFPNIFGTYDTRDLPKLTVASVDGGEEAVAADIRKWSDYINEIADLYVNLFAEVTTDPSGTFGAGVGGGEMQPYTEYGNTLATRTSESTWVWGLPIRRFRDAQAYTEEYVETKSLAQINKDTIAATNRYLTTRMKLVQRAILGNVNYTFTDRTFPGSDKGPLYVKRLFNADGTSGNIFVNGTPVAIGALQHYVTSGSATVVIGQFTLGRTKLRTLGETGRVIHVVSPTDEDTVKALSGFIPAPVTDPYVRTQNGPSVTTQTAVVTMPRSIGVISNGGVSDGEVIVVPFWPAGYTLSFDATQPKPVAIRQHENAKYQGFKLVQDQTRAPYGEKALRNKLWEYIAGAGVVNRGNGVVVQASTSGTYTPPNLNA